MGPTYASSTSNHGEQPALSSSLRAFVLSLNNRSEPKKLGLLTVHKLWVGAILISLARLIHSRRQLQALVHAMGVLGLVHQCFWLSGEPRYFLFDFPPIVGGR